MKASELESIANMTIQSILTGSANREAHGARKRKISDFYDEQAKRHNSLMSDGENYQFTTTGQQQVTSLFCFQLHLIHSNSYTSSDAHVQWLNYSESSSSFRE